MTTAVQEARLAIEQQIDGLEEQITQLRQALEKLGGNGQPESAPHSQPARRRSPTRKRSSSNNGSGRAARGEREAQFLAAVEKNPGATGTEIAAELGITPNQVHGLAHRLSKAGRIRKRRGGGYAVAA